MSNRTVALFFLVFNLLYGCGRFGFESLAADRETDSETATGVDTDTAVENGTDSGTLGTTPTESELADTGSEIGTDSETMDTGSEIGTASEPADAGSEIGTDSETMDAGSEIGTASEPADTGSEIGTDSESADTESGMGTTDSESETETAAAEYELTVLTAGNGTVSPSDTTSVAEGEAYPLAATPLSPYRFEFWKQTAGEGIATVDDINAENASVTVIGGDVTITAYFDNATWAHEMILTLDTTSNGADVADTVNDFPLLVRLTSSIFTFSQAQPNGEDIRFADSEGAPLDYEIERWDSTDQEAEIWVSVPTIIGNGTTDIKMLWGQTDVLSQSDGWAVFDETGYFTAVWHLTDETDSTSNENDLTLSTPDSPTAQSELIGDGMNFAGTSWLGAGTGPSLDGSTGFSVSAWVRTSQDVEVELISQRDVDVGDVGSYRLIMQADGTVLFDVYNSLWQWDLQLVSTQSINDGEWHHVFAIRSGASDSGWIYIDGAHSGFSSGTPQDLNSTVSVYMGKNIPGDNNILIGDLDEIRIQHEGFFEAWLKLCYENQRTEDYLLNNRP